MCIVGLKYRVVALKSIHVQSIKIRNVSQSASMLASSHIIVIIIIIIIKNECHSNIIVDRLQGCSHSKKLRESESESRSSKVI